MNPLQNYSVSQLTQAIQIKRQQERLNAQLEKIGGSKHETNGSAAAVAAPVMQKRRKRFYMTQARRDHLASMRTKLAAMRMGKGKAVNKPKFSAAARAKISAAMKARWARVKAVRAAS